MPIQDESVRFEVIGKITNIQVHDLSKRAGVKNLHTNLTLQITDVSPQEIAAKIESSELSFTRQTDSNLDSNLLVGDMVVAIISTYDFSQPEYFTLYDLKKL